MTSFKTPLKALALVSALALGGLGAGAATQAAVAPQPAQASCEYDRCINNRCEDQDDARNCSWRSGSNFCATSSCGDQLQVAD